MHSMRNWDQAAFPGEAKVLLREIPGWTLTEKTLERDFIFADFHNGDRLCQSRGGDRGRTGTPSGYRDFLQ